ELPLHHPLDRVELLVDDLFPARVRRADDELRRVAFFGGEVVLVAAALPVPKVDPCANVGRDPFVGLGLEDVAEVSFPGGGGLLVLLGRVDLVDVLLEPRLAREERHGATSCRRTSSGFKHSLMGCSTWTGSPGGRRQPGPRAQRRELATIAMKPIRL